jgi:acetyl-CoA acetyltransferase
MSPTIGLAKCGSATTDATAVAGVGLSPYGRRSEQSIGARAIDACVAAIEDAGIDRRDIDGICGSTVSAQYIQAALGIESISWFANPPAPIGNQVVASVAAIVSGMSDVVLVYHATERIPGNSRAAAGDELRRRAILGTADHRSWMGTGHVDAEPFAIWGPTAYASWASRYLHQYRCPRERLGLVAISNRTHAGQNENAVAREPLAMDAYLGGRMVRHPLCVFDMDLPIDGADAFVITTRERAQDLRQPLVLIHAATLGQTAVGAEDQLPDLHDCGQTVVARALWARSDIGLKDVDLYLPYDGFSIITLCWLENIGYCGPGEAGDFVADHWDDERQVVTIDGHVEVNTHGGSLSEGASQGAGHLREAVIQLRGHAGRRQVPDPAVALITSGGFFFNAQGVLLRVE